MVPFRNLLTVVPQEETTKHRLPAGLANTYLQKANNFKISDESNNVTLEKCYRIDIRDQDIYICVAGTKSPVRFQN